MRQMLGLVVLMLGIAACAVQPVETETSNEETVSEPSLEEMREASLEEIDMEACVANGGTVQQEGLLGMFRCTTPYADAGKTCRDESDCAGRCMGRDDVTDYEAKPGEAVGVCEATDSPFGCFATLQDGTPSPFICVD